MERCSGCGSNAEKVDAIEWIDLDSIKKKDNLFSIFIMLQLNLTLLRSNYVCFQRKLACPSMGNAKSSKLSSDGLIPMVIPLLNLFYRVNLINTTYAISRLRSSTNNENSITDRNSCQSVTGSRHRFL